MIEALSGIELLVPTTLNLAKTLIQPGENVVGCIRETHVQGEKSAFILLDTRLLCIIPRNWGRKSFSIQYADIRTVAIEDNQSYLRLIVEPAYKGDVDELDILIKARHKDYTVKFAEVLRTRVRDAQMPSRKVEIYEKSSTLFIDELERLAALHKQGNLSDEEFAAAKKKLLS